MFININKEKNMTDIMKHQGYISNEDRNKNIKKLDKGNG
jgi:hypothetical protein